MVVTARLFEPLALVPHYSAQVVRRNLGFGLHMVAISTLSLVFTQGTQVILSALLNITEFGFYGFLYNLAARAAFVPGAISQAAQPALNKLASLGEEAAFQAQFRKLQDLVSFGTAPIFALIPFASLPFLSYLFSPSVAASLMLPATLLSLGVYMNAMLAVPFLASLAVGRPQIATQANVIALLVVLPVSAALVIRFGLSGAAFSWVFYHLFAFAYQIPRYSRECLHIPVREWYLRLLRVTVAMAVSYGLAWAILSVVHESSPIALALAYLAASLLYLAGAWLLIGPELRASTLGLIRALRTWRARP
jgi:O-antigen/teichoic acid export membrane protein